MSSLKSYQTEEGKGLKIASVEAFTLHVSTEPRSASWNFARVTTKEGIVSIELSDDYIEKYRIDPMKGAPSGRDRPIRISYLS